MIWGTDRTSHGGRWAMIHTPQGQAAVLLVVSGTLSALSNLLPGGGQPLWANLIFAAAIASGLTIPRLPWARWSDRATLLIVPLGFGLVVVGQVAMGESSPPLYGLWYMIVFAWVGVWHPPRTSLALAPLAAAFYVVPFLPSMPAASSEGLRSVIIAIPMAALLGEVMAAQAAATEAATRALRETSALLEEANLTDDLTGLGNRRSANALLDALAPGDGLVILDLDHFKLVNDTRGHAAGDRLLSLFGEHLRSSSRRQDTATRFGGEEFLVVIRSAGPDLVEVVERLLDGWQAFGTGVTVSGGATVHRPDQSPQDTFAEADALLYQAKDDGRDRVMIEGGGPAPSPRLVVRPTGDGNPHPSSLAS